MFDFIIPIDNDKEEEKKNKWVRIYEEDNVIIESLKTTDYIQPREDNEIDLSSVKSARGSE